MENAKTKYGEGRNIYIRNNASHAQALARQNHRVREIMQGAYGPFCRQNLDPKILLKSIAKDRRNPKFGKIRYFGTPRHQ